MVGKLCISSDLHELQRKQLPMIYFLLPMSWNMDRMAAMLMTVTWRIVLTTIQQKHSCVAWAVSWASCFCHRTWFVLERITERQAMVRLFKHEYLAKGKQPPVFLDDDKIWDFKEKVEFWKTFFPCESLQLLNTQRYVKDKCVCMSVCLCIYVLVVCNEMC